MNMHIAQAERLSFAKLLADLAECRSLVYDLCGDPEPEDARDVSTRLRKISEAYADYVERELRSLKTFSGADIAPAGVRSAVIDTWMDFIRPELVAAEEFLVECAEHETDLMQQHGLGKQQMGLR